MSQKGLQHHVFHNSTITTVLLVLLLFVLTVIILRITCTKVMVTNLVMNVADDPYRDRSLLADFSV